MEMKTLISKIRSEYPNLSGNITTNTIVDLAFILPQDDVAILNILKLMNEYFDKAHHAKAKMRSGDRNERSEGYSLNNERILVISKIPPEIRNLLAIRANGVYIEPKTEEPKAEESEAEV
jgi:hypothetical protein